MKYFNLKRHTTLPQEKIFDISTDVKNFHKVMPDHFKSLSVIEKNTQFQIVLEKISFFGIPMKIKTKHIIIAPDIHEVHILSGPLSGTFFMESYTESPPGSLISIDVNLKLNGFIGLFGFLEKIFIKKMSDTLDEFVSCAERFTENSFLKAGKN